MELFLLNFIFKLFIELLYWSCVCKLAKLVISNSFLMESLGFLFTKSCHVLTEIVLLLSGLDTFISFSYLILLARTFSTVLNRNDQNSHSCLIHSLKGKAFSVLPLNMILTKVFHRCPLSGGESSLLFLVCWFFLIS